MQKKMLLLFFFISDRVYDLWLNQPLLIYIYIYVCVCVCRSWFPHFSCTVLTSGLRSDRFWPTDSGRLNLRSVLLQLTFRLSSGSVFIFKPSSPLQGYQIMSVLLAAFKRRRPGPEEVILIWHLHIITLMLITHCRYSCLLRLSGNEFYRLFLQRHHEVELQASQSCCHDGRPC